MKLILLIFFILHSLLLKANESNTEEPTLANAIQQGIEMYSGGDPLGAIGKLQEFNSYSKQYSQDQTTNAQNTKYEDLRQLTLARLLFQQGNYSEAYQNYLNIPKSSPLWLSSMIEQSWAQILAKDFQGAAGNMFTLHTEYFRRAYLPESYIVMAIAYLNLCQYADSLHALKALKARYTPELAKLDLFLQNRSSKSIYQAVRAGVKVQRAKRINGIPVAFWMELARSPEFLRMQSAINQIEDQISEFNTMYLEAIQYERGLWKAREEIYLQLNKIQGGVGSPEGLQTKQQTQLQDQMAKITQEYEHYKSIRPEVQQIRKDLIKNLSDEKDKLIAAIEDSLKKRLGDLSNDLKYQLNQGGLLELEIFSVAGDELRRELAGAQAEEGSQHSTLQPDTQKSMKWGFQGEIWEDELGFYRSSLTNVCSNDH